MSKVEPLVSVIVTTYNREIELQETIQSILEQTYKHFEILVVDNYSDYDIKGLIDSYSDSRIRLIQNHNNGLYVVSRNRGVTESKGDFVTFCDDDDMWLPGKLESQLAMFAQDQSLGLVYSKCQVMKDGEIYRTSPPMKLYNGHVFYKMIVVPSVPILTAMVKKEVFDKIGLFNEDVKVVAQEDNEFWIRLAKEYPVRSTDEPSAIYREHSDNFSNEKKIQLSSRIYLHNKLLKSGVLNPLQWLFIALPGVLVAHYGKVIGKWVRG